MRATTSPSTTFSLFRWAKADELLLSPLPFRRNSNRNGPRSSLHFTDRCRNDQLHDQGRFVSVGSSTRDQVRDRWLADGKCTSWCRSDNVARRYLRRRQPGRTARKVSHTLVVVLHTPSSKPLAPPQNHHGRQRAGKPYFENQDFCHWQPVHFCVNLETTQAPWAAFENGREAEC